MWVEIKTIVGKDHFLWKSFATMMQMLYSLHKFLPLYMWRICRQQNQAVNLGVAHHLEDLTLISYVGNGFESSDSSHQHHV